MTTTSKAIARANTRRESGGAIEVQSPADALRDALREFVAGQRSADTRRTFKSALGRYADFLADRGVAMLDASPTDVREFRDERLAAGLKPSTVALELSVVRNVYGFLREARLIDANPAAVVKSPQASDESFREALTVEEAERILATADPSTTIGKRDKAMLALLCVNGLRLVELARARVGDVGRDATGVRVLVVTGKGGRREDVKIRDDVGRALDEWNREAARVFGPRGKSDPLFPALRGGKGSRRGGPMQTRAIRVRVDAAIAAAGLKPEGVSAHWLRHTAVTQAILNGATLLQAQTAARHRDPKTTQRYFHALAKHGDSAVDRVPIRVA